MKKKTQEVPIKKKRYISYIYIDIYHMMEEASLNITSIKLEPVVCKEEPESDDDRYVFCDNCLTDNLDYCKKCGVLKVVPDKKVLFGKENRAKLTLPDCLEIKQSPIHNLGVFAKQDLEANLQFSYYEGLIEETNNMEGYSWKLKNGSLINGSDEKYSNWLRYVNFSSHVSEQNIHAFQYRGKLYYRTCRNIKKGQELLVYYRTSYAEVLGIQENMYYDDTKGMLERNDNNKTETLKIELEDNHIDLFKPKVENAIVEYFQCDHCQLCLTTDEYKFAHMKRCKLRNCKDSDNYLEVFKCKHCYVQFFKKELCVRHEERCFKLRVGGDKAEKFECDICLKRFTTYQGLLGHIKYIHEKNQQKEFKCGKCTYKTVYICNFNVHVNSHEKKNKLKCKYCEFSPTTVQSLNSHIISKHKEHGLKNIKNKIHSCTKCKYSTLRKSCYDSHIKRCLKLKDVEYFKCNICSYKTIHKSCLRKHIKTHLERKELKCLFCSYECSTKTALDNHILLKHSKLLNESNKNMITCKTHSCPHCSYITVVKTDLKRHINRHH